LKKKEKGGKKRRIVDHTHFCSGSRGWGRGKAVSNDLCLRPTVFHMSVERKRRGGEKKKKKGTIRREFTKKRERNPEIFGGRFGKEEGRRGEKKKGLAIF